ncbi:MAG TPA: hypothetical protein PKN29_02785 [Candidatus Ozemobacteraceae bacterium]|nr:hypothetical protein [Candidatus Ozemobacteraceae bacterium]
MVNSYARILRMAGLILAVILLLSPATFALAPEYERNGECYLLIGQGPTVMKGVFRLNNPEKDKYFDPSKHLFTPNNTFSFAVDLNRNIYTFTEEVESGFTLLSSKLKRQVLDGVSADHSDWGYHAYFHYDHRSWGAGSAVYRVGPAGRTVRGSGSRPKSAGPGTSISTPAGNPLPSFSGALTLNKYDGRNWYEIPNGSWYSSWKTAGAVHGFSTFYVVFGDKEEGKAHNWKLFTWTPNNPNLDAPVYANTVGKVVATSYDKKITRQIFAGCLDGCGGASGSGSGVADEMTNDLAFMPPIKAQPSRTYFYSRPKYQSGAEITLNGANYVPAAGNPLIGLPDNTDTLWIGVSMRNVNSDYVYTLGTSVIKDWYKQATGVNAPAMNISAVAVSNQWNQEGGIVFAYDQDGKMVYKFERKEKSGSPISKERYQAIPVSGILSAIGAKPNSVIDDIKADGFGNMYFAMSHPAKSPSDFDPRSTFDPNEAIYLHKGSKYDDNGTWKWPGFLIFKQGYGKVVFQSRYGKTREIGRKDFAVRYYNVPFNMRAEGTEELMAKGLSQATKILASWSAVIGNNNNKWDAGDYNIGTAGAPGFYEYTYSDPGMCRLSVINVPTPDQVISLAGKKSFLDIVGPYLNMIPPHNELARSTAQNVGLINPMPSSLAPDQLYFFMVENYPLANGTQDPTDLEASPDWDKDGKHGGFITSLVNPETSTKGGKVFYRWRTWLVEDLYGNPVCKALEPKPPTNTSTGMYNYHYFYSPVPGKYILTCQVLYDWYDYDLLAFGSTIDDLPSVLRKGEKALPVKAGSYEQYSSVDALNAIMLKPEFKFMVASASSYLNQILEGGDTTFAMVPIVVSGSVPPQSNTLETARIQRCDVVPSLESGAKAYLKNNTYWHPQTGAQPTGGFHGLEAGKAYYWRMDVASQTNLFFDISKSNDTNPASNNYNYVAAKLLENKGLNPDGTEKNPFYVNRKPEFQFMNKVGDVRWAANSKIRVTAHLEYKVPKAGGGYEVQKKFLIQDNSKPGEPMEVTVKPETTVFSNNSPIVTQTGGDLPPTDPTDATLVITMRRMFEYDMYIKIWNGTEWIVSTFITLPKDMVLESKTTVKIIDMQQPRILYSETSPNNLFGETGNNLTVGVGPSGKANPSQVRLAFSDNNPWEAVDSELGITNQATYDANRQHNVSTQAQINSLIVSGKPSAHLNLKPVFAKLLNRKIRLAFETSSRDAAGRYLKSRAGLNFDTLYSHYYTKNAAGAIIENNQRLQKDSQTFSETAANGNTSYFAKVFYKVPLNFICVGNGGSLKIPAGYANNTPGYYDAVTKTIKPYEFYVEVIDSSGNKLAETPLNMVLHVRDNMPPNPYGIMTELKDNTVSYFPLMLKSARAVNAPVSKYSDYSFKNLTKTTFDENFSDLSSTWSADATADGYINGKVGYYQSLKSMGDKIVAPFNDAAYTKQIDNVTGNGVSFLPPRFLEDNVEAVFQVGVSDNAGIATATLTFNYFDSTGAEKSRSITSGWQSTSIASGKIASTTSQATAVFRGAETQFPMAIPVKIVATDNARDWDFYTTGNLTDINNPWSTWKWGAPTLGGNTFKTRTYKTSVPVYGSNLIIRTLDKTIRNQ